MKKILYIILLTFFSACNLKPLYSNYGKDLAYIKVESNNQTVLDRLLVKEIRQKINPKNYKINPEYYLETKIETKVTPLGIERDQTITRYQTTVTANYNIYNLEKKLVDRGSLIKYDGFDKTESEYSTYVSEEKSKERAVIAIADELVFIIDNKISKLK